MRKTVFGGLLVACSLFVLSGCSGGNEEVTLKTLLEEMTDRENMAYFPEQEYQCKQFSSYNTSSKEKDDYRWFANVDNNFFLRTEMNNGRREFVLFDAEGPGAVVRFWTTFNRYDKEGVLRFYFDGEEEPRIEGEPMSLISGGALVGYPLSFSVSEDTEYEKRGHNLYLPIPFSGHLKITYETDGIKEARIGEDEAPDPRQEMYYYQINYRVYEPGTPVKTFSKDQLDEYADVLAETGEKLKNNARGLEEENAEEEKFEGTIAPGEELLVAVSGEKAVRKLQVKLDAENLPQALRSTVVSMRFDDQETVWAPVGDFFGAGYKINPVSTWYNEVLPDGTLQVFWVMPFREEFEMKITNYGDQEVKISEGEVATSGFNWNKRSMYFGSSWYQNTNLDTGLEKGRDGQGDFFDINYVTLNGQGVLVGDAVTLFDCSPAWWGEGDEKIFVDNEDFPSHFGTGTEDYYGYAWCRNESFDHSFIAQPEGTGNLDIGYTLNLRYRALDAIPFKEKLQFDMEIWHWAKTRMNHAPVTYWYIRPGGTCNIEPDMEGVKEPVVLNREEMFPPKINSEGIVEGEDLIVESVSGESGTRIRPFPVEGQPGWFEGMMTWNNIQENDEASFIFYAESDEQCNLQVIGLNNAGRARLGISVNGEEHISRFPLAENQNDLSVLLKNVSLKQGPNVITFQVSDLAKPRNNSLGIEKLRIVK